MKLPVPTTSIGAFVSAMTRHFSTPKPDETTIRALGKAPLAQTPPHPPNPPRRHPGPAQVTQLRVAPIAPDRPWRPPFQHGVARRRVETLEIPATMRVQPPRQPPGPPAFPARRSARPGRDPRDTVHHACPAAPPADRRLPAPETLDKPLVHP